MNNIINKKNILGLVFILAVDNLYLHFNKNFYTNIIEPTEKINVTFAVLTWITIIVGINLLVLSRSDLTNDTSFVYGAYLGFAMYALYNCTDYALYPSKWNIVIATGDTLWGTLLTGTTAYLMYNYF